MKRMIKVAAAIVMFGLIIGCEPDKITIQVPVSAIEKARNGGVVYLKASASGSPEIVPDSVTEKKDQIQHIIEQALGKGSRVTMQKRSAGMSFSAKWKVPLFKQGQPTKEHEEYPIGVVLTKEEDRIMLISNKSRIDAMNEKLDNLDFMMEKISELGMTELVFDNDGDSPFSYTVYGAFIDGKAKVSWTEKVTPGDESTVAFGRKSEDSIWHEIVPIVFLSGK